jgi:hypothetical protein
MHVMARFRGPISSICALVGFSFVISLSQGCARSERSVAGSAVTEQKLPFHSDTDPTVAVPSPDLRATDSLPFAAGSHILPSGTLLTVQLEDALSTSKVRAGDTFTALVTAPLTIDGAALIKRGAAVTGRVESARSRTDPSALAPGYFRLTLSAITVEGRRLPLQTSSLFARGSPQLSNISSSANPEDPPSSGIKVEKGRRLTFRLTAPVALDDPSSIANRQNVGPLSE